MWQSSGRESYVFRGNKPGDLRDLYIRAHADLMEKALRHDEGLFYLLYSPICQERKGPFGLHATPASHAVAVTQYRFVISEDRHMNGIAPAIQSIPFDQVLYVQLGSAMLLGWFSIELAVDDKPSCTTIFFPATTGMKHFGIAVSEYRRMTRSTRNLLPSRIMGWADIWRHSPKREVDHLKPLILKEELPFKMLRSSEQWILRKMRRKSIPACLSTNGVFVSTNFGFISVTEEEPVRPGAVSFGVNVSSIAFNALRSARLREKRTYGRLLPFLQLELARGSVALDFDVPFDRGSSKDAETLVYLLTNDIWERKQDAFRR